MKNIFLPLGFVWTLSTMGQAAVFFDSQNRVVGSVVLPPFELVNGPRTLDFDVNNDGQVDFTMEKIVQVFGHKRISINDSPGTTRFVYAGTNVGALDEDFEIGGSLPDPAFSFHAVSELSFSNTLSEETQNEPYGEFARRTAYLGFEFQAATGTHYGYALLKDYNASGMVIEGVAWESTPGKSILAGAIPEPTTAGLLGLAVVLGAGRRRRVGSSPR